MALAAVPLVLALATTSAPLTSAAAAPAQPGAPSLGDPYFPGLGNGGYDAGNYDVFLSYPGGAPDAPVPGVVTMTATALQDLSRFNLDYAGDNVSSVRVNGVPAGFDYQTGAQELVITPSTALPRNRSFTTEVSFTSHPKRPAAGNLVPQGWIATDHGSFTAFQADRAHEAIPTNDYPSDKATWTVRLEVPSDVVAVSNGALTGKRAVGGRVVWSYREANPLASELLALAVGTDLEIVDRGTLGGVKLRDVISRDQRGLVEAPFANAKAQTAWTIGKLGAFPFSIYGNMAPDLDFAYSLEIQGISLHSPLLFNPNFLPGRTGNPEFYEPVVVHEDVHQLYGDSVTPSAWVHMWMNEGPATYFMMVYAAEKGYMPTWGYPSFEDYMRDQYAQTDAMRAAYGPVGKPRVDVGLMGNANIYDGAALVLYALRKQVGDRAFAKIMRQWPVEFKGRSVCANDFIRFAGKIAGQDLRGFLNAWLYGETTPAMPGHPEWTVTPVGKAGAARSGPGAQAMMSWRLGHGR